MIVVESKVAERAICIVRTVVYAALLTPSPLSSDDDGVARVSEDLR